jgi:diphosphomevalonate decarboxylase
VEFERGLAQDLFSLNGETVDDPRIARHLDLVRQLANSPLRARVTSRNDFPAGVGMASSASGFAALTVAACAAAGLELGPAELSRVARRGSGSASRSVPGAFAELRAGPDDRSTYAVQLAGPDDLDFRTLVVTVGTVRKKVSSSEGMRITASTSPMLRARLEYLPGALAKMRDALRAREAQAVGQLAETDTLSMHACMLTSDPPLLYWTGGTLDVIHEVVALREEGKAAYFSIDAGQNVFVNTSSRDVAAVRRRLESLGAVRSVLECRPGPPAQLLAEKAAR